MHVVFLPLCSLELKPASGTNLFIYFIIVEPKPHTSKPQSCLEIESFEVSMNESAPLTISEKRFTNKVEKTYIVIFKSSMAELSAKPARRLSD